MDHLNHPGKFFFLSIERWTCQNFHFLQKTIEKIMFFHFLEFQKFKNNDFPLFFQQKWNGTKMGKSNFTQKSIENYDFYVFRKHKIQKSWFFNGFWLKMNPGAPKNHDIFILHLYTSKKWKKSWFFARTHFSNFEFN